MASNDRKRQLKAQYKETHLVGGVYRIVNKENGRYYLNKAANMNGARNLYITATKTGTSPHPHMAAEWVEFGPDAFEFEVLETWEQDEGQSDADYQGDLMELLEAWKEKLPKETRY